MPKTKKRGKGGGNRGEKEKPLLTVQGVLRLEKSFVTAQHEDAEVLKIKTSDDAKEAETVRLIPGASEHDLVQYKLGYDIGPGNPFPQNEPEKELYEQRKAAEAKQEAFEELKKQSEAEKKAREEKFQVEELEDATKVTLASTKEQRDPDNPDNYFLPEDIRKDHPAFFNDRPLEFAKSAKVLPPGDEEASLQQEEMDEKSGDEQEVITVEVINDDSTSQEGFNTTVALGPDVMKPLPDDQQYGKEMVLSVALQMEEKRKNDKKETGIEEQDEEEDDMIYSLDEMARKKELDELQKVASSGCQGPEINEIEMANVAAQQPDYDAKRVLESYWQFVRENPHDFNGWTYLLQHVENIDLLDEVRTAYNAFLPLYPYCYAYWVRYSETEKRHQHWSRALAILHRGLEAIPLSVDLWLSYLELYHKIYKNSLANFDDQFGIQCQRAVATVGLDFKCDSLWERYIEWEAERKNLRRVTDIYGRLVSIPTKLYNKHWDNFIAHVRDHHPRDILDYQDYDELRRVTCKELGLTYRPDPIMEPETVRDVVLPEDKLKAGMKERIVASLVMKHETCQAQVEARLKFEEKIKRPYFHVKPLDVKQLRNWEAYLDYEMAQGDHERCVVLFERCLIPCAKYEQFWAKYARYLEKHLKEEGSTIKSNNGTEDDKSAALRKARWAFGTGLVNVDDIRERRCMWTLRGWKRTDKDGNEVMVAEEIPQRKEGKEKNGNDNGNGNDNDNDKNGVEEQMEQDRVDAEMNTVLKTSWSREGQDSVRSVYTRACVVHCSTRAMIKLRWAAFEEECVQLDTARDILTQLIQRHPLLLEACMQLVDLERRSGNFDKAIEHYKKLLKRVPANRKNVKTWVAMKLARFHFKVCNDPEKALSTLRSALKKERGEPRLYSQIIDVCYQRQPVDTAGVTAAIELALQSPDLTNMQKLELAKRKVEFMQEFGDISRYRDACDQIKRYRTLCATDLKVEARKRKELEKEEQRLKELEELKAQTRANANMKGKIAEAEGRLMCTQCQTAMYPDAQGNYEFENFVPPVRGERTSREEAVAKSTNEKEDDGIVDLLDMEIPEEQEEAIKKTLEEKTKYKEVAPTWELNIETYGYGKRRKVYDPDYEHVENAKFREYERLEGDGYEDTIKDKDHDKPRNLQAHGLGHDPKKREPKQSEQAKYTTSDYVVPPKVPQLQMGPGIGPVRPVREGDEEEAPGQQDNTVFELPPELANPQKSPCVNVPEWFVKEGGELCLSETSNGISIIRYWPKFLSEKGNKLMFNRLRKYCKWHQKQVKIDGQWKYETRLVAWYGPCDYNYSGLSLDKNLNWAPELLDLLHRLIAITRHDFNSCFCNLYRHGHDMCGWHADVHPQLGRNPAVASVSLGAVRVFEFRRKSQTPNFIRFPLFPGSLLVMEGATQEDWLHCLPRDINCKEERVNLTFRTMYSIDKRRKN